MRFRNAPIIQGRLWPFLEPPQTVALTLRRLHMMYVRPNFGHSNRITRFVRGIAICNKAGHVSMTIDVAPPKGKALWLGCVSRRTDGVRTRLGKNRWVVFMMQVANAVSTAALGLEVA